MAATHYVLIKDGARHAVYQGEKRTLCDILIDGGERGRDMLWFGQTNCPKCRREFAMSDRRIEGNPYEGEDMSRPIYAMKVQEDSELVPVPAELVAEDDDFTIFPEDELLYDEVFTAQVERRMRTITFVQALFRQKGKDISIEEAAKLLEDPMFLATMIGAMSEFQQETIDSVDDLEDVPLEVSQKVKAIFSNKAREG